MIENKICFVSDANQENYVKQFNDKIESLPKDFDFTYYVCTNLPDMVTKKYPKLKVFDLNELQNRTKETLEYEKLKDDVKLAHYPANIRRHIINKAFEDGFDYVVWNDCDVKFSNTVDAFIQELKNFKINTIYTQNVIYRYGNRGNQGPFTGCDQVLEYFNHKDKKEKLKIHDGPTAIYFFDEDTKKKYIKVWDDITLYGYEKPYTHKKGGSRPMTEVYTITFNEIDIEPLNKVMFKIKHEHNIKY
jgi:hypothetical protein